MTRVQRIQHGPASASRRSSIKRRAVANQFESGSRRCHIRMTGSESERTSRPLSSAGLLECQHVEPWAREFLKSERALCTIALLGSCSTSTQGIEWRKKKLANGATLVDRLSTAS